jgi:hypothetical protein
MQERFDRLLTLRGDPKKGLPASAWAANLGELDRDQLLRALIDATRKLLLAEWKARRPDDVRPQAALEATEAWLTTKSADSLARIKATAKDCTAARGETFGDDHRVPEAARAIAWAAGAKDNEHIWDALTAIEGELLARITLIAEYHRAPDQRKAIVQVLRDTFMPVAAAAAPTVSDGPVPYSPQSTFSVGQTIVHPKFGTITVTAVADKMIDAKLDDGTTKRLVHKPKA